jgi:hypothetical protein
MLQSFYKKYPVTNNKHQTQNEADVIRGQDINSVHQISSVKKEPIMTYAYPIAGPVGA